MNIEILPPKPSDSCYDYRVRSGGITLLNSRLTYELYPESPNHRNLLLIKDTRGLLTEDQHREYDELVRHLEDSQKTRFYAAKSVVNVIAEGSLKLRNVRVAIHRFGPVPVYVPPGRLPTVFHGKKIEVSLAFYPRLKKSKKTDGNRKEGMAEFFSSKKEFVTSLELKTGRVFERYFEDVAEYFYDIEFHLGLTDALEKAKHIERILAESVKSKLKVCIPSCEALQAFDRDKSKDSFEPSNQTSCRFFRDHTDLLFNASFARNYALYFLNELYRLVGISSRAEQYRTRFGEIEKEFDDRTYNRYYEEATRHRLDEVGTLWRALVEYPEGNIGLGNPGSVPLWVERFVGFAQFVADVRRLSIEKDLTPETARVFLSYHHNVAVSEALRSKIETWSKNEMGGAVRVLHFNAPPGPNLRDGIRRTIWMTDSVHPIVPSNLTHDSEKTGKDYKWIGIEAEHGLLCGKRPLFLIERGTDLQRIKDQFGQLTVEELLAPLATETIDRRLERLLNCLGNHIHCDFSLFSTDPTQIDPQVSDALKRGVKEDLLMRCKNLILGFLGQLTPEAQRTMVRIQQLAKYPNTKTKQWLAQKLFERYEREYRKQERAGKDVTNTWNQVRNRSLHIKGKNYTLMVQPKKGQYAGDLTAIAKALLPSSWEDKAEEVVDRVVTAVDPGV